MSTCKSLRYETFLLIASFFSPYVSADENRWASPTILVDVSVKEVDGKQTLSGVHYYRESFTRSFHHESTNARVGRVNLRQQIVAMASEIKTYKIQSLDFITPNGKVLEVESFSEQLDKHSVVYVLPPLTTLHPSIMATLRPDVAIATQKSSRGIPAIVVQSPPSTVGKVSDSGQ